MNVEILIPAYNEAGKINFRELLSFTSDILGKTFQNAHITGALVIDDLSENYLATKKDEALYGEGIGYKLNEKRNGKLGAFV